MLKRVYLLLALFAVTTEMNANYIAGFCAYLKNCGKSVSNFFVINPSKNLADISKNQPNISSKKVTTLTDFGYGYNLNKDELKNIILRKDKSTDRKDHSFVACLAYDQLKQLHLQEEAMLPCKKGPKKDFSTLTYKKEVHPFILKKLDAFKKESNIEEFDPSLLETFDGAKELYKTGEFRPSAEADFRS